MTTRARLFLTPVALSMLIAVLLSGLSGVAHSAYAATSSPANPNASAPVFRTALSDYADIDFEEKRKEMQEKGAELLEAFEAAGISYTDALHLVSKYRDLMNELEKEGASSIEIVSAILKKEREEEHPKDPWETDPLTAIPDPTDQVVYFAGGFYLLMGLLTIVLCIGIWRVYKGGKIKSGGMRAWGVFLIIAAIVVFGLFNSSGQLSYYMTQAAANELHGLQPITLSVSATLYSLFGTTNGGGNPVLLVMVAAIPIASFIALIIKVRSFGKAMAEKAGSGEE